MVTNTDTKWRESIHRFGAKFDHSLLSIQWQWRIRDTKRPPAPDFERMNQSKWEEFDHRLTHQLAHVPHTVKRTAPMMGEHYDRVTKCINETIRDTIPPKKPWSIQLLYNCTTCFGRKVSTETKRLYDLHIRDFASDRKIDKSDRTSWNRILSKTVIQDYQHWVQAWSTHMELTDENDDIHTVHQGVKALAGKSKSFASRQPTRKDKQGQGRGHVVRTRTGRSMHLCILVYMTWVPQRQILPTLNVHPQTWLNALHPSTATYPIKLNPSSPIIQLRPMHIPH